MKKIVLLTITLFLGFVLVYSQTDERIIERVYISTDKDCYVAGDVMWCSAYCFDIKNNTKELSNLSSIAYLELHSTSGLVQTGKIALINGRGAGKITLSANLPTGNYKLLSYTSQNKNEVNFDIKTAKTISVFNTFTKDRVPEGVELISGDKYSEKFDSIKFEKSVGNFEIILPQEKYFSKSSNIPIKLKNNSSTGATINVSVFHDDDLITSSPYTIDQFINTTSKIKNVQFSDVAIPEYEGEIIKAKVVGPDSDKKDYLSQKYAVLSSPGNMDDIYISSIDTSGKITFFTNNIYGDKDLFCEIEGLDSTLNCHIELESPFIGVKVSDIPKLYLCGEMNGKLAKRGVSMQLQRRFDADTLYQYLTLRENPIFCSNSTSSYILDDYTRFPLMEEVFVEFIPQIRARKTENGKMDIQVRMENVFRTLYFSKKTSLVLLDGVPIFDHDKIFKYDPLLVERIDIYADSYLLGKRQFEGIINISTYKKNLPSLVFDKNVRIINFQGASFPMAYTCSSISGSENYPDYRETIYWHPNILIETKDVDEIECVTPAYGGKFTIVVEGVDFNGNAIYQKRSFEVK